MPDSGNTTYWGEVITFCTSLFGFALISTKMKGRQDTKIENIEGKIVTQDRRIDSRVHVNDFKNLEKNMGTEFSHVKEALERIEEKIK